MTSQTQKQIIRIHILLYVRYYHVTKEIQSESTLYSLPECQGTPCSKQADSNPQPLSS